MKIVHNRKAYAALLRSTEMLNEVRARAERIAAAAGPGFEASSMIGRNRARASVRTADVQAIRRNSRDNTLIRSLDAGRD